MQQLVVRMDVLTSMIPSKAISQFISSSMVVGSCKFLVLGPRANDLCRLVG
jgi:hypothetical protein